MGSTEPETKLDGRFSSTNAAATEWAEGSRRVEEAELFWLSTVRSNGRPHVTPLIAVWVEEAACFCTGAEEQKAVNLAQNPHCVLMTGCNQLDEGLDVALEGEAKRVLDDERLKRIADAYESKYGSDWHFDVRDGAFRAEDNEAIVFEVAPVKALGFAKGDEYSQTRWRFA